MEIYQGSKASGSWILFWILSPV